MPKSFPIENKNDVISNLIASSTFLQEDFHENISDCLQFLFSYDINGNQSLIFKCSPEKRKKLKDQGDVIKIGYNECKLYNRFHVTQCSKRCAFGHVAQNCRKILEHAHFALKTIHTKLSLIHI